MTRPVFFCDLDRTLIYSTRQIDNYGTSYEGLVVAEALGNKPFSFMTFEAARLLAEVSQRVDIVPCTTRNLREFNKVALPDTETRYAIINNGATILENDVEDADWSREVRDVIASKSVKAEDVLDAITALFGKSTELLPAKVSGEIFVSIHFDDNNRSEMIAFIDAHKEAWGYTAAVQRRKVYLIPSSVTKEAAAEEIKRRLRSTVSFAAGDSFTDLALMEHATYAMRPAHGELFEALGYTGSIPVTGTVGVGAGEEIVQFVDRMTR